ncbi:MAG: glutathione S-transferase family protein [Rickettsiaceae bacterium]
MKLYHHTICPFSRQIRLYLKELDTEFKLFREDYWLRSQSLLKLNPAGNLPVLMLDDNSIISGAYPITEYFNDAYQDFIFMSQNILIKSEIRRLIHWCNDKLYHEVTKILINEKFISMIFSYTPRVNHLQIAHENLMQHLKYFTNMLESRSFLACDTVSAADIALACHISIIDYFGQINWDKWHVIKNWYVILKSRPSFQELLHDRLAGFDPPLYYHELDF